MKTIIIYIFLSLLYVYHQSIPDYMYMYVGSVKWQYRT